MKNVSFGIEYDAEQFHRRGYCLGEHLYIFQLIVLSPSL